MSDVWMVDRSCARQPAERRGMLVSINWPPNLTAAHKLSSPMAFRWKTLWSFVGKHCGVSLENTVPRARDVGGNVDVLLGRGALFLTRFPPSARSRTGRDAAVVSEPFSANLYRQVWLLVTFVTCPPLFYSPLASLRNSDGLIDFEEFRAMDKAFPLLFFPAFRLQDSLQKHFLGATIHICLT